jgi:hypothetical protein
MALLLNTSTGRAQVMRSFDSSMWIKIRLASRAQLGKALSTHPLTMLPFVQNPRGGMGIWSR